MPRKTMISWLYTLSENHLMEAERANRTVVQWHTFDKMVCLINEQKSDRVQGKDLKARDVAGLKVHAMCNSDSKKALL